MVIHFLRTDFAPRVEGLFGGSWAKLLSMGLTLLLGGVLILSFPRLVAFLIAVVFFLGAAMVLSTAYHLWQLERSERGTTIDVD
ncbi:MAG: hypothetical protein KAU50_11010 [Candidatus Marinimicrobia bacterium]|nr:hypothetical protein [Candidatus Neomarinimicrobiota bacterium]